jgi:hypothetical protein
LIDLCPPQLPFISSIEDQNKVIYHKIYSGGGDRLGKYEAIIFVMIANNWWFSVMRFLDSERLLRGSFQPRQAGINIYPDQLTLTDFQFVETTLMFPIMR